MSTPLTVPDNFKPPVDRPRFVNRVTLCPVCLKPCDVVTHDIVVYWPVYLAPFDTLRAYDGFYHRACLYQVGDYSRMVTAWHQGERTLADNGTHQVIAIERDIAALRRTPGGPIKLLLFPRFAHWAFADRATLEAFTKLLTAYHQSSSKRTFARKSGDMVIRPVANQDLMVLRWSIPLVGNLSGLDPTQSLSLPRQWINSKVPLDLEVVPVKYASLQWIGGQLETGVEWNLARIAGEVVVRTKERLVLSTHRLRFVPIWDDEVTLLLDFLTRHRAALQSAVG